MAESDPYDGVWLEPLRAERRVSKRRQLTIPSKDWEVVTDPETCQPTGELQVDLVINRVSLTLKLTLVEVGVPVGEQVQLKVGRRWYVASLKR